jgi:hypothetical protein
MRRKRRVQIKRVAGAYWLITARREILLGADTLGELRAYWHDNVLTYETPDIATIPNRTEQVISTISGPRMA